MRNKIRIIIFIILFIGLLPTTFIFAQKYTSDTIQALQQQIAELQKQIVELQAQLEIVKKTEVPLTKNIIFTKILQRGMKDGEVKTLQEFFKQYSDIYPEGIITGYFGPLTEAAVKKFQAKYSIESIGIVGPKTRNKLNELVAAKPPQTLTPILEEKKSEEKKPTPTSTFNPISTPSISPTPAPSPAPITQNCSDGTFYNQCSAVKPKYCDKGTLTDNCETCGCGAGFSCQTSGSCQKSSAYPADDLNGLMGPIDVDDLNALIRSVDYEAITSDRVISLIPPADWPDELKNEWNDNITEIQRIAERIKEWNWESLRNEDLPKLIQWGQTRSFIKIIYIGAGDSGLGEVPRVTVPGINAVYQALSLMPPHIIQMFEGGGIGGKLHLSNKFSGCITQAGSGSATPPAVFYIINCPYQHMGRYFVHELGHIVDFTGIRNMMGKDFSFGKTDEAISVIRKEYDRIFQSPLNPLSDYLLREAFANWFRDYVINGEHFRKAMAQDSRIAEKYEFLKTKIFLGKEY